MADEESREAVLTVLQNAEPDALTLQMVQSAAERERDGVSDQDVEDALRELTDEGRIEKLDEDDGTTYRIS
jgi:Fe2+ or Zn2+ uptake regulation protein